MSQTTCPLCKVWEMMPYHKRWSTPTTPQECEGAMVAGWWAAFLAIHGNEPEWTNWQLCDRHQAVTVVFDKQHEERKRVAAEMQVRVTPDHAKAVAEFLERAKNLAAPPPPPKPTMPAPVVPTFAAAPVPHPIAHPQPAAPVQPMAPPDPVAVIDIPKPTPPTTFPCPLCGKPTFSGDVHTCAVDEDEPEVKSHKSAG